jgi:hypothetical protein
MVRLLAAAASVALVAIAGDLFVRADNPGSRASATVRTAHCAASATAERCARPSEATGSAVEPGKPLRIDIPAIGLHTAIAGVVSTHEGGRWTIDPPKQTLGQLERVYWWSERAAPADPSTGAAYLYGHSCTHLVCAFNDLDQVSKGDLVRIRTARGVLTYRVVAKPIRLAKTAGGIGSSSIYNYGVADRLVLITCGYLTDGSSPFNWVVIGHLSTGIAAR